MRQIAGTICYIRNGPQTSTPFTKDADGRWTTLDIYNRPTDAAKLPAGTLERESDRLIAAARSGQPAARIEIGTQVDELADLVRGGRIVQAYDTKPLGLSAKRVAVILSTRTIGEQARYQKMYAALVAGNGRKDDSTRKEALAAADPGALLTGIAAGVRKQAASVIPADDLSVLAEGKADYALVVDWGFDGRVDYSRRQYASLAVCGNDQYVAGKCPSLFQEKFTAYLIGSDLKAVRRITLPMSPLEHTQEREPAFDNTDEDYYTTYFIEMGVNFRNLWGPDGGMAASIAKSLAD